MNDFRAVVYKNGYPNDKFVFDDIESAELFRDEMIARRKAERSSGKWQGTSWHYIAERNY